MIEFVALLLSATAYGVLYAATPDRRTLRKRPAFRTRVLLAAGTAVLAAAVAVGTMAWGHVTGPTMVATIATATASVLVVAWPFCRRVGAVYEDAAGDTDDADS